MSPDPTSSGSGGAGPERRSQEVGGGVRWQPADLAVGATLLGGLLFAAGLLIWLASAGRDAYPLYTRLDRIEGMAERAPVYLRGYQVGRVEGIQPALSPEGSPVFEVRMSIRSDLFPGLERQSGTQRPLLPVGTTATLRLPPFLGPAFIELELPDEPGPPLEPESVVPGVRAVTALEQVQFHTGQLNFQLAQTLETARMTMDTLMRTGAAANHALATSAEALPVFAGGLAAELALVDSTLRDLRLHMATLSPSLRADLDSAALLMSESRQLVSRLNAMLAAHEPRVGDILVSLDSTTKALNYFVREFSDRPFRVLLGGVSVPPAAAGGAQKSNH